MSVATNNRLFQLVSVILSCAIVFHSQFAIAENPSVLQQAMEAKESKKWKEALLLLSSVDENDPDYDSAIDEIVLISALQKDEIKAKNSQSNFLLMGGVAVVASIIGTLFVVRCRAVSKTAPKTDAPASQSTVVQESRRSPPLVRKVSVGSESTSTSTTSAPQQQAQLQEEPPKGVESSSKAPITSEPQDASPKQAPVVPTKATAKVLAKAPANAPAKAPAKTPAPAKPPVSRSIDPSIKVDDPVRRFKVELKKWERGDTSWATIRDLAAKQHDLTVFRTDPDAQIVTLTVEVKDGASEVARQMAELAMKAQRMKK